MRKVGCFKIDLALAALSAAAIILVPYSSALADSVAHKFEIRTLSTRPDMVSGGSVLIEVRSPSGIHPNQVRVTLNGQDVTNSFREGREPGSLIGLVGSLKVGRNTLATSATGTKGGGTAKLDVINHPISGPVFSGPQQKPFICETENFVLPVTNATLGPPTDTDCSIAPRVDYVYRSTDGTFKPLPDPKSRPSDATQATTNEGRTVNYIVRIETGTINRAVYQTAILHDPSTDPAPDPWTAMPGWNGRLIYNFGGYCAAGYHQGQFSIALPLAPGGATQAATPTRTPLGVVLNDAWLSQGYAVATSTLNVFGNNCNDVISAETMMMVKEHFIDTYGSPRYTIGSGASGGSMQQHLIAQNYPGLLDGIQPSLSFPDDLTFVHNSIDCMLLDHAFDGSTEPWTLEQKTAVSGAGSWTFCASQTASQSGHYARMVNPKSCAPAIPLSLIYDAVSNRSGIRCTWQDNSVNIYGVNPRTGFAPRDFDNVGVQYGLIAFNEGQISADQFVDLNEHVGGYDVDGNLTTGRVAADPDAPSISYRTGRVNTGVGGLSLIPIIDFRAYRDDLGDVHDASRSYAMRARLLAANGNADNQVILFYSRAGTGAGSAEKVAAEVLRSMDQWLSNIASDTSSDSASVKVRRNKPADLVDACYGETGEKIIDESACKKLYPAHANPRLAAGEAQTDDILKCALKPVDSRDYPHPLTAAQMKRLKEIFAQGVCDYGRQGVGQQLVEGTWLSYPLSNHLAHQQDQEVDTKKTVAN